MPISLHALLLWCLGIFVVDDVASLVVLCLHIVRGCAVFYSSGMWMPILSARLIRLVFVLGMTCHILLFKRALDYEPREVRFLALLALPLFALLVAFLWWDVTSELATMSSTTIVSFLLSWVYIPWLWSASKDGLEHAETIGSVVCITHRLNHARFKQLTRRTFTASAEDPEVGDAEKCSICLSEFNAGEKLLQLNCGHIYHDSCITHWFFPGSIRGLVAHERRCPLRCRAVLTGGVLVAEDEHTVVV